MLNKHFFKELWRFARILIQKSGYACAGSYILFHVQYLWTPQKKLCYQNYVNCLRTRSLQCKRRPWSLCWRCWECSLHKLNSSRLFLSFVREDAFTYVCVCVCTCVYISYPYTICSICGQEDSTMLWSLVPFFGEVLVKMGADLREEDVQMLVDAFKTFCSHEDENIRRLCAYNLPAVLKCMGPRKFIWGLQTMYLQLIKDSSPRVRATIASSFHEITKMLGKEKTPLYLKEPLIHLLKDTSREVQGSLLPILQHVLGQFSGGSEQQRAAVYGSLIPHLLQMEKAISSTYQWRLQLALLNAFPQLMEYVSSDQVYEHFVPICFRYMTDGALPVRSAATLSLAIFIRNNRRACQRCDLSQRVVREFANGQSYWLRIVFIEFCESMLKTSSSQMFKEHFLEPAIVILQDAVASVRMRACLLIPPLKAAIKLPDDVQALERINFFATQRLNDNDRQVAAIARSIADCLKHANIRLPGNEKMSQAEFEAMDKLKEEEEWNMLSKEEQEEKRKIDEVIQKMKVEPYKKGGGQGTRKAGGSPSVKVKSAGSAIVSPNKKQVVPGSKPILNFATRTVESDSESSEVSSLPQSRTQSRGIKPRRN